MSAPAFWERPCPGCKATDGYDVMARDAERVPTRLACHRCRRLWHVDGAGVWASRTPCDRCGLDCELMGSGQMVGQGKVFRFEPATCGWRIVCELCHDEWKAKLHRLITLVSSYPEPVVDAFIKMAGATATIAGNAGNVTKRE
jgi:hypothetical protein